MVWNHDLLYVHSGMYQVCTGMYHTIVWYQLEYKPT
jgi:hypothetical protein